jgi:hypothetical protein
MSPEVLVLGLFSGLRPGTSLAAVIAVLKTPAPRRPLLVFCIAGFAWSWLIGVLVVSVLHGAATASGGSTLSAVLDVTFGAAALVAAVGVHRGWVPRTHRRGSTTARAGTARRFGKRPRGPSGRVAAAAGVFTHIPGLVYLVALNTISSARPVPVDAAAQVAVYVALWFLIPFASLVLVIVRPSAALAYLEAATAWLRRHSHAVAVSGLLVLGGYLVAKGMVKLLS